MSVYDVLSSLEELVEKAWNLPLSGGKCVVDAERFFKLIDEIRAQMPSEVKQAQTIVEERRAILDKAKSDAEQIVRRAEERARGLVRQEEVLKEAQRQANETLITANNRARDIKNAASDYADSLLKDSEKLLNDSLNDVRQARASLKARRTQG